MICMFFCQKVPKRHSHKFPTHMRTCKNKWEMKDTKNSIPVSVLICQKDTVLMDHWCAPMFFCSWVFQHCVFSEVPSSQCFIMSHQQHRFLHAHCSDSHASITKTVVMSTLVTHKPQSSALKLLPKQTSTVISCAFKETLIKFLPDSSADSVGLHFNGRTFIKPSIFFIRVVHKLVKPNFCKCSIEGFLMVNKNLAINFHKQNSFSRALQVTQRITTTTTANNWCVVGVATALAPYQSALCRQSQCTALPVVLCLFVL